MRARCALHRPPPPPPPRTVRHHRRATTDLTAAPRRSVLRDPRPELPKPVLLFVVRLRCRKHQRAPRRQGAEDGSASGPRTSDFGLRHRVLVVNEGKAGLLALLKCWVWALGIRALRLGRALEAGLLCEYYFGGLPTSFHIPKCWPLLNNPVVCSQPPS